MERSRASFLAGKMRRYESLSKSRWRTPWSGSKSRAWSSNPAKKTGSARGARLPDPAVIRRSRRSDSRAFLIPKGE